RASSNGSARLLAITDGLLRWALEPGGKLRRFNGNDGRRPALLGHVPHQAPSAAGPPPESEGDRSKARRGKARRGAEGHVPGQRTGGAASAGAGKARQIGPAKS